MGLFNKQVVFNFRSRLSVWRRVWYKLGSKPEISSIDTSFKSLFAPPMHKWVPVNKILGIDVFVFQPVQRGLVMHTAIPLILRLESQIKRVSSDDFVFVYFC